MTQDRFKNFIDSLDEKITCDDYIHQNRVLINDVNKNPEFNKEIKMHKALSNKKRFLILKILQNQPICTCALAKVFGTTDGAITHHLKILENAGLIIGKKQGYFTMYYTKESLLKQIC
ncbi:MAG: ArsR/SmtB family transcription factor [Promethearchaeota archaeon]